MNLGNSDLVAAEGRHHISCQSEFLNPIPKHAPYGRSSPPVYLTAFNIMCDKMEDDSELQTAKNFHEAMHETGDVYSSKL